MGGSGVPGRALEEPGGGMISGSSGKSAEPYSGSPWGQAVEEIRTGLSQGLASAWSTSRAHQWEDCIWEPVGCSKIILMMVIANSDITLTLPPAF